MLATEKHSVQKLWIAQFVTGKLSCLKIGGILIITNPGGRRTRLAKRHWLEVDFARVSGAVAQVGEPQQLRFGRQVFLVFIGYFAEASETATSELCFCRLVLQIRPRCRPEVEARDFSSYSTWAWFHTTYTIYGFLALVKLQPISIRILLVRSYQMPSVWPSHNYRSDCLDKVRIAT